MACLCLLLAAGGPGAAEEIPPAIGRISYGDMPLPGAAICSGVLVAPDLVLTAAHCVRGAAGTPAAIRFEAGWKGGSPAGLRQGAEVILTGEAPAPGLEGLVSDVALIVLEAPFPSKDFPPLPLAAPRDDVFTLIGFDRMAPDLPTRSNDCAPVSRLPGLLGLGCAVVSGNSGAPLLQADGAGWQVVAVMVAAARGNAVQS